MHYKLLNLFTMTIVPVWETDLKYQVKIIVLIFFNRNYNSVTILDMYRKNITINIMHNLQFQIKLNGTIFSKVGWCT